MSTSGQQPGQGQGKPITIDEIKQHFESDYQVTAEPWDYSQSGAELLRYKKVVEIGRGLRPKPERLLEIGCSLGLFSIELAGWPSQALVTDIAPTAVEKARRQVGQIDPKGTHFEFAAASGTDAVTPPQTFDVITLLDVLESVADSPHIQEAIIKNLATLLKKDGILMITDYTHPSRFESIIKKYEGWGLKLVERHYMNDRLWYSCRTNLKAVKHLFPFKQFLASQSVAKGISAISALRGANGSKHMLLVMQVR